MAMSSLLCCQPRAPPSLCCQDDGKKVAQRKTRLLIGLAIRSSFTFAERLIIKRQAMSISNGSFCRNSEAGPDLKTVGFSSDSREVSMVRKCVALLLAL